MNILLIFFAIPVATIILAGILETFINCPFKIAGIFFSIFLVVAFALGGTVELLVAAIIYTIIAFATAYIVMIIRNRQRNNCNSHNCCCRSDDYRFSGSEFNNFETIPFGFNNDASVSNSLQDNENNSLNINNSNCGCRRFR